MGLGLICIGQHLTVGQAGTEYGLESPLGLVQREFHIIRPVREQQILVVLVVLPLDSHRTIVNLFPFGLRIRVADLHCHQVVFLARRINQEGVAEAEDCAICTRADPGCVIGAFDHRVGYRPAQGITGAGELSLGDQQVIAPPLVELDAKILAQRLGLIGPVDNKLATRLEGLVLEVSVSAAVHSFGSCNLDVVSGHSEVAAGDHAVRIPGRVDPEITGRILTLAVIELPVVAGRGCLCVVIQNRATVLVQFDVDLIQQPVVDVVPCEYDHAILTEPENPTLRWAIDTGTVGKILVVFLTVTVEGLSFRMSLDA